MKTCIKPANRSWGARPPRALLDAPRVQPFGARNPPARSRLSCASEVFRGGAENCARGGRAPQVDLGCRAKNLFLLPALIAGLGLILSGRVTAQTFTTLHSFTAFPPFPEPHTNSDGASPVGGLILSGNTLYGTANQGGSSGAGTVFAIDTDGTGFTTLYSFSATSAPDHTNSDGAYPDAGLILSGNTLYGTTDSGGSGGYGTVFKINTDGTGFTNLHTFTALIPYYTNSDGYVISTNSDGAGPSAADLILSGNTLYGTAQSGGSSGGGTVFAVNTDGTGFTTLHTFTWEHYDTFPYTNSDGIAPAGLILSGNTLFGTAQSGGSSGGGTVFAVNADGTGFKTLYNFTGGSDEGGPFSVILSGVTLFGTTTQEGPSNSGTVFAVNTDGTGFTTLYSFTALDPVAITNSDGALPQAQLILSGNTLYGTAYAGGPFPFGNGTVFALSTDGMGFTNLHNFTSRLGGGTNSDGADPLGRLILSGNTLYGTASQGGSSFNGTIFSLLLGSVSAPQLRVTLSGPNLVLTWPTDATGFTLQSTTNLVSPAVWTTVSPGPVVLDGQNAVTNLISGAQQFYRLSQ